MDPRSAEFAGADQAAITTRVRDRFARIVGPEEAITLFFVAALSRTRGAKVRRVAPLGRAEQGGSKTH